LNALLYPQKRMVSPDAKFVMLTTTFVRFDQVAAALELPRRKTDIELAACY